MRLTAPPGVKRDQDAVCRRPENDVMSHGIHTTQLCMWQHFHLTREIEAQRACVTNPRPFSWYVAEPVLEPMMSTLRGDTIYILLSCVQRGPPVPACLLSVFTAFLFLSPLDNQPSQLLTSKGLVCLGFRNGAKGQFTQIQGPPLLTSDLGVQSPVSKMDMKYPE